MKQFRADKSTGVSRRTILKAGVSATASALLARSLAQAAPIAAEKRRSPNLVLLVTDDQRSESLGCAGNPILRTPNIDALAAGGVRFTNSFATSAICMSSRASILTGLHTRTHGVDDFSKPLADSHFDNSYPKLLKNAGYRTGFIGKWGIDKGPMPTGDYDFFKGFQGQGRYLDTETGKHLTVTGTQQAIEFLRASPKDQPFCLAVSFKAPHVQDEGRFMPGIYAKYPYDRALESLYQDAEIPAVKTRDADPLPMFFERSLNRTREAVDFLPATYQETMRDLYRLLAGVDQAVGKITGELRSLGFDDNTVILYTADHGSFYGEHGFGGKWLMHEESIRTPMILHDPRRSAEYRGVTREQMVLNIDVPATLLQLAGVETPAGMQGRSMLPLIDSASLAGRSEWFYENHFRNQKAGPIAASEGIRTRDWKYIRYIDTDPVFEQLYDLKNDPREEKNLAGDSSNNARLIKLRARWQVWNDALDRHQPTAKWTDPAS